MHSPEEQAQEWHAAMESKHRSHTEIPGMQVQE